MPWDPVFFASLHNRYMFRLSDGSFIDGKKTALSRAIYLSCRSQGHLGFFESCDETWLHSNPPASSLTSCTQVTPSQFAIGQIVNHATRQSLANLAYIEIVLQDFQIPIYLRPYLPNVLYSFSSSSVSTSMRVIVLVATRNIEEGEELFTIYFE